MNTELWAESPLSSVHRSAFFLPRSNPVCRPRPGAVTMAVSERTPPGRVSRPGRRQTPKSTFRI